MKMVMCYITGCNMQCSATVRWRCRWREPIVRDGTSSQTETETYTKWNSFRLSQGKIFMHCLSVKFAILTFHACYCEIEICGTIHPRATRIAGSITFDTFICFFAFFCISNNSSLWYISTVVSMVLLLVLP